MEALKLKTDKTDLILTCEGVVLLPRAKVIVAIRCSGRIRESYEFLKSNIFDIEYKGKIFKSCSLGHYKDTSLIKELFKNRRDQESIHFEFDGEIEEIASI